MAKYHRSQKNGTAIWKFLGYRKMKACPECHKKDQLTYLGFVETYVEGAHGKMYQCKDCGTWIDVIWDKKHGRHQEDHPAKV